MSEAASGFWLVPIPAYRGACHLCARALTLVAGARSRDPLAHAGNLLSFYRRRRGLGFGGSVPVIARYHAASASARALAAARSDFNCSISLGMVAISYFTLGIPRCSMFSRRLRQKRSYGWRPWLIRIDITRSLPGCFEFIERSFELRLEIFIELFFFADRSEQAFFPRFQIIL